VKSLTLLANGDFAYSPKSILVFFGALLANFDTMIARRLAILSPSNVPAVF